MDDQVGEFIGGETIARQPAVVAAHGTVMAILSAVIGDFDHAAHEHAPAEMGIPRGGGVRVEGALFGICVRQPQEVLTRVTHGRGMIINW